MRRLFALLLVVAALARVGLAPLQAQDVEPRPDPPQGDTGYQTVNPDPAPLAAPDANPDRLDPHVVLDGTVRVVPRYFSDFEWRLRLENGSDETISSISYVVPERDYDSRTLPDVPRNWAERREAGQGPLKGNFVVTFFSLTPEAALRRGHILEVALRANTRLLIKGKKARVMVGTSTSREQVFPWEAAFLPLTAPLVDTDRKPLGPTVEVPYPVFSFLPLPTRTMSIQQATERDAMDVQVVGQGVHFGRAFQMTLHSPHPVVATLARGTVMVPSLRQYDVMIVGRPERVVMAPQMTTNISLRAYSISYGRKAPPPRVVLHDLIYHFKDDVPAQELGVYRRILERALHLRPRLDTPLRANYHDAVVQWALWRAQRLMESNPLSVRDVEREMAQIFTTRRTLRGEIRDYLQPLQVFLLSKQLWADTELLLNDQAPAPIP